MNLEHEDFMGLALAEARHAAKRGEVPVGAVLTREREVLATAHNLRESQNRPTAHAELLVIEAASWEMGTWRLEDCRLYITLEPCLMCWGAIILARIPEVIFGAFDPKAGVCGSVLSLHRQKGFNHHPQVQGGVLAQECGRLLSDFFTALRSEKKIG